MKLFTCAWALLASTLTALAAEPGAVEQQVAEAVKAPTVTIVHLWAPWCSDCTAELKNDHGWPKFLEANPDVKVIFVTVWRGEQSDGRAMLEQYGLGQQPNLQLLVHENASRKKGEMMSEFLGQRVTWIPTTWIYRGGTLRYALNYGRVRFPILQQLTEDARGKN